MAVAVTNSPIVKFDTEIVVTSNAATSTVADATEAFTITPTRKGSKVLIRMNIADSNGAVAFSVAVGSHFGANVVKTGSIAENTTEAMILNSGRFLNASGAYVITFTPASGKKLLTDHALVMEVIEMPF
jgi:hypothetical protein